ncbi:MAG: transposase [Pirellulaceae bacterium]
MSTYASLTYHVVFSTKYRRPAITDSFREELYQYIGGIIRGEKGSLIEIGGIADHVHILAGFHQSISVSQMLQAH